MVRSGHFSWQNIVHLFLVYSVYRQLAVGLGYTDLSDSALLVKLQPKRGAMTESKICSRLINNNYGYCAIVEYRNSIMRY